MAMKIYDLIVLGSGAAGLTAALSAAEHGATVLVVEKGEKIGGTSAWSGGQIWIPCNPHMKAFGKEDSREKALTYLASLSNDLIDPAMAETYVDGGVEMVAFLEERTPVQFSVVPHFPDYYPEQPGAAARGGRALECPVYPYGELGDWADKVKTSPYYWPHIHFTVGETSLAQAVPDPLPPEESARRAANDERGLGHSLVGRLLKGCLDRGAEFLLGTGGSALEMEGGAIAGVRLADGKVLRAANVTLATGGFEHNEALKKAFLRDPLHDAVSINTNTCDGQKMAMRVGAMMGSMREAWWMPIVEAPLNVTGIFLFTGERTLPGTIMVNCEGKRFCNKAANDNAFGSASHEVGKNSGSYRNLGCWCVFNQAFYDKCSFLDAQLIGTADGYCKEPAYLIARGATLADLAGVLGVPTGKLEASVERWDAMVDKGAVEDFGCGESYNELYWGDPAHKGHKDAALGRIDGGPYYAAEVKSGALGTKGGAQTDTIGRVLDLDIQPCPSLYAAGNAMASMMGMTCGEGGMLGPGTVYGHLAGKHIAALNAGYCTVDATKAA